MTPGPRAASQTGQASIVCVALQTSAGSMRLPTSIHHELKLGVREEEFHALKIGQVGEAIGQLD